MSVPTADGNQPLLMPKLQYRFRVRLIGFGSGGDTERDLTRQVIDVTRPNLTFENIVLDVYNSKVNIAGKHTWDTVTLTLREDITNGVQTAVGKQLQRQFDFWEQRSATAASSYKFRTEIEILDGGNGSASAGGPIVLEKFTLVGCYLEAANYNSLNYATNDAVTVTLTIRYDNAIQYGDNSNTPLGVGDTTESVSQVGSFSTGSLQT
jgi:hypothetical protein